MGTAETTSEIRGTSDSRWSTKFIGISDGPAHGSYLALETLSSMFCDARPARIWLYRTSKRLRLSCHQKRIPLPLQLYLAPVLGGLWLEGYFVLELVRLGGFEGRNPLRQTACSVHHGRENSGARKHEQVMGDVVGVKPLPKRLGVGHWHDAVFDAVVPKREARVRQKRKTIMSVWKRDKGAIKSKVRWRFTVRKPKEDQDAWKPLVRRTYLILQYNKKLTG